MLWSLTYGHWGPLSLCPVFLMDPKGSLGLLWWLRSNKSACNAGATGNSGSTFGSGRSPGESTATHFSILAWRVPWSEKPGGLRSTGSWRVGHGWSGLEWRHEKQALECCVGFWCTTKWISYMYTYTLSLFELPSHPAPIPPLHVNTEHRAELPMLDIS